VDPRSDVYSLGCVIYELLTGQPPFTGDTALAIAYQHVREDPKPPSSINKKLSPDIDAVVLKSMSKNPANRYQSAAEMREDLLKIIDGERPSAPRVMSEADRNSLLHSGEITGPSERVPRAHGKPVSTARPRPRSVFAALALAVVAAIVGTYLALRPGGIMPTYVRIPTVAGQSEQQATDALHKAGLKTIAINKQENSQVKAGIVIDTSPQEGTSVDPSLQVFLNVSAGLGQVSVPDLTNLTQGDAISALQQVGLDADTSGTTREFSDTIPKDRVIRTDPENKTKVDRGKKIRLVLSNGKKQIQVPNVVGMQIDDARKAIAEEGLIVGDTVDEDSTEPQGKVLSTEPPVGATMDRGSSVKAHVSKGNLFVMPDLTGMTADEAKSALNKAGSVGAFTATPTQDVPGSFFGQGGDQTQHGKIFQQSPPAGTTFNKLSTVTAETYK
jgi:serine/threonine-protein kinase